LRHGFQTGLAAFAAERNGRWIFSFRHVAMLSDSHAERKHHASRLRRFSRRRSRIANRLRKWSMQSTSGVWTVPQRLQVPAGNASAAVGSGAGITRAARRSPCSNIISELPTGERGSLNVAERAIAEILPSHLQIEK
jgi:hypothetical protein